MNFLKKNDNEYKNVESTRGINYVKPHADIIENENAYKIVFDLPGIDKKDISIKVEKGILNIVAENSKKVEGDYNCIREEIEYTGYRRAFNLNDVVDTNSVDAEYKDGTLILTLLKKEEEKSREIEIKAG